MQRSAWGPICCRADFYSLNGSEQLLILCNLDRLAYGLPAVTGLSPVLNAVAATGVTADADPDPSALLGSLSSFGWSSNWAGGYGNALEAYYAWMYSDGWAGRRTSNLDCTSPTSSGCWGHRQDVLAFSQPGLLSMGASVSTRRPRARSATRSRSCGRRRRTGRATATAGRAPRRTERVRSAPRSPALGDTVPASAPGARACGAPPQRHARRASAARPAGRLTSGRARAGRTSSS
jgi:hypothetical protein